MSSIQKSADAEIEAVIRKAIDHGINYFHLCIGATRERFELFRHRGSNPFGKFRC